LNIDGNVVISGSTTSIDVQQLTTNDTNITLNDIASPGDPSADGGGFTLKGATDKTFNWVDLTDSWTSSEHIDLIATKEYTINATSVLSATTLGAGVVSSSLTSVGTLTALQVDTTVIDGNVIGLTTDTDLITLTNNTVTVAGTVAATQLTGGGAGITGLTTSNITVPASPGDFLYNNAGAWGGITPPITVALGGTGATTAAAARTALGVTATGADTAYNLRANNLNDVANAATARTNLGLGTMAVETATNYLLVGNDLSEVGNSTARTNLGLGTANSPKFGGVGTGTMTVEATPSSGGTVAPTFSGTSFKSVPVASGSGHKWVVGNEQAGNLTFSYFTINDAGANTSSAVGYITLDPSNTRGVLGNTGGTPVNVIISGLSYPTADGTAGYVLQTDGAGTLSWTNGAALSGALLAANNLSDLANAATSRTNLGVANTTNIAEGTNEYWTNAKFDTRFTSKGLSSLADVALTGSPANNDFIFYNSASSEWLNGNATTTQIAEGGNLYYTNARADARIALQAGANLDLTGVTTSTLPEGTNLYYTNARTDARIVNAGSANWNTSYTDTNAATSANTASTIVKRDGSGNVNAGQITANTGVILGNNAGTTAGTVRWTGTDFQGYNSSNWVSLTSAATAQISGAVATFTTSPTVTGTSFADISGYTASVTVTTSNIINVQVNVDLDGPESSNHSFVKLVRVVSGTPTDLYEDESASSAAGQGDHFNISYADVHGQSNGTVITYKLMARVSAGTLTVNPNGTNAQIFVQEMTTTPTAVSSVNGASGTVVLDTDDIAEGSSNKYFTTSGATVNTDNLAEGTTNLYHQDDLGSV
jgi:hypothetical protein